MRKTVILVLATILVVSMLPSTALAWSNGPPVKGKVGNGYGTHDWILDHAIKQAGANGKWVRRSPALLASDDPDSQKTIAFYHWYKESGACRGAPYIVSEYYNRAVVAYQAGNMVAASRYLGIMSHYYADITQPFHTTDKSARYLAVHNSYEYAVDDYQHKPTGAAGWMVPRATVPVTDIRAKTVSAALYARSLYPSLVSSYKASHKVSSGTPYRVTRLVMSRSVNDLADIISTIPSAAGKAPAPANINMNLNVTYPRQKQLVGTYVTCTDANGQPMNAVGVKFVWRLPTGTKTWLTFTDANGRAYKFQDIGNSPLMRKSYISAYVTVNGSTAAPSRWFMPTREAAPYATGFLTTVTKNPTQGADLNMSARLRDTSGHGIPGIPVTFTWSLDSGAQKDVAMTDAYGVARLTRYIGNAPVGKPANVSASVQVGGRTRGSTATFWPAR